MHTNLPDNFAGGYPNWRLRVLDAVASALGLLVRVEGFPYGTARNCRFTPGVASSCPKPASDRMAVGE